MNSLLLPKHRQLREDLLRQWKYKRLKKGAKVPSQTELVDTSGLSLATVVKTLKDLETDGIITRKVGLGSFLQNPVWETGTYRVGFYYNRDVVGGSILNNPFYGNLLRHLESTLLKDEHGFIYGSFSSDTGAQHIENDLDAIFVTGGPLPTDLKSGAVISQLDAFQTDPVTDTFHLDVAPAFERIIQEAKKRDAGPFLYVDSLSTTAQTGYRLRQFTTALHDIFPEATYEVIACDAEHDLKGDRLMDKLETYTPGTVLGYIRSEWKHAIKRRRGVKTHVYHYAARGEDPESIEVDYAAWSEAIWARTFERIQNTTLSPVCHHFPAL